MKPSLLASLFLIVFLSLVGWANYPIHALPTGVFADRIVMEKSTRQLSLYSHNILLKRYEVSLGKNPVGKKQHEGDARTPEGVYNIDFRKSDSAYHLALHISYPKTDDVKNAQNSGFSPGGAIMIHGMKNGLGWLGRFHRFVDWTQGCIAVTDLEIEEIWRVVPNGIKVEIKP